jgi:hypothetical protein
MGIISILRKWFRLPARSMENSNHQCGICPKCNGTGRIPCPPKSKINWQRNGWFDFDPITETIACPNCGDQYQYSQSTGIVRLNREGNPCLHQYVYELMSKNIQRYECIHCNDEFYINLSDLIEF